jgi:hypothetical protein
VCNSALCNQLPTNNFSSTAALPVFHSSCRWHYAPALAVEPTQLKCATLRCAASCLLIFFSYTAALPALHHFIHTMQVALGPGSGGGANAAQVRNIALCSQLQEVHRSLVTLLPRLPAPAAAALSTPLEALQATAIDTGGGSHGRGAQLLLQQKECNVSGPGRYSGTAGQECVLWLQD